MAIGVNSVLNMGVGALFASSANIQVTGNNISNVNTPGYSRQSVVLNEKYSINFYPGQVGQGVEAKEIIRNFDAFIEANYLNKLSTAARWQKQYSELRYVDNLFNEQLTSGLGSSINSLFDSWNKLSQGADTRSSREALLGQAQVVASKMREMDASLRALEDQMNVQIKEDVSTANKLMQEIAQLNREIAASYQAGRNNPNELMDKRDEKVRELATIIDIDVEDRGPGHYTVSMKNGNTLVQHDVAFKLDFKGAQAENNLTAASPYKQKSKDGAWNTVHFAGSDSYEYTVEMVSGGEISGGAQFKVSLDGGNSWLTNDDGSIKLFNAQEGENAVRVGELDIWFDPGQVAEGDRFVISPKSDVYWISPTSGPLNISTQIFADGRDNSTRITGGSLGGLLEFRDYKLGEYRDRLDALAKTLAWEVNRIHSQGAGLESMSSMLGTYAVGNLNAPLGTPEARFTWADRLQSGNMNFAIYDAEGNSIFGYPGLNVLSINGGNFDPEKHSMYDVVGAINDPANECSKYIQAEIVDGRMKISAKSYTDASGKSQHYSFAMTDDTTGLAAAFGLNTFFTGDSAATFGVNQEVATNINRINAGRVNINGEIKSGDNQSAKEIAGLATKVVTVTTIWNKSSTQTIADYYGGIVTKVGSDTQGVGFTAATETAIAQDLYNRQEEISGVNLDEEMSNLIKFQASYKAAAKLITTADEMLQTLLSLKQ